jgi:hypothetical protein
MACISKSIEPMFTPVVSFISKSSSCVTIHPEKLKKFKEKIKQMTPRNHGMNIETMVKKAKSCFTRVGELF